MADIALTNTGRVEVVESLDQDTKPAAAAIGAGQPILEDANGKWAFASSTNAATAPQAVSTRAALAGEALTGLRKGTMDGFNFGTSVAHATTIYGGTNTISTGTNASGVAIGRVESGWANALGTTADKLLRVNL